jgi:SAM-dependent methyltransferase
VNRDELQERIDAFPVWHYQFELEGATTPIFRPDYVNRHEQRRRIFFDPLVAINGGSLRGRRILDLGCNAGYWSLNAIDAGADFVLGIDGRQEHVDQANLVFSAKGVDPARYRFELGNIFAHKFSERFDVVLCLGLMYHVAKPVELFEIMTGTGAEIIVVDTNVSLMPSSAFRVAHEDSLDNPRNAIDYELVLVPSRQALLDLAGQFGFETVALAHNITDFTGMGDYRSKQRAAFICSKSISLAAVASESMDTLTLLRAAVEKRARREWRRAQQLIART